MSDPADNPREMTPEGGELLKQAVPILHSISRELARKYSSRKYSYEVDDVYDEAQELFVTKYLAKFDPAAGSLSTFLYAFVKQDLNSRLRRRYKTRECSLDDAGTQTARMIDTPLDTVETLEAQREMLEHLISTVSEGVGVSGEEALRLLQECGSKKVQPRELLQIRKWLSKLVANSAVSGTRRGPRSDRRLPEILPERWFCFSLSSDVDIEAVSRSLGDAGAEALEQVLAGNATPRQHQILSRRLDAWLTDAET